MNKLYLFNYRLISNNLHIHYFIIFIILFLLSIEDISPQTKKEIIALAKGDSVVIIPTFPPASNEGINIYRKGANRQFELLNTKGPITPITDNKEIMDIFGDKWDMVVNTLGLNAPSDLVYRLNENPSAFFFISLKFPEVLKIAGCWFVDHFKERNVDAEYKLEYLKPDRTIKETVTKKIPIRDVKPLAPLELSLEEKKEGVFLQWKYPAWKGNINDLTTQFYVYRSTKNEQPKRINIDVIVRDNQRDPSYTDNELMNQDEYTYYITAVDIIGVESSSSNSVKILWTDKSAPSITEEVKIDTVDGKIGISWKMNLETDAKGYNIFRSTTVEKSFVKINTELLPIDKTFFYDNNFTLGEQYFYAITCIDSSGNESEKSNPLSIVYSDTQPPDPPSNFSYKIDAKVLRLSWTPSKATDLRGYYLYRGESREVFPKITHEPIKGNSYVDEGIQGKGFNPGGRYIIAISAIDNAGNESEKLIIEDILFPDTDPPSPPVGVMIDIISDNQLDISCGASSSQDVKEYKLFRSENSGIESAKEVSSSDFAPFTFSDTTVSSNNRYIYYSVAIDSSGNISSKSISDTVSFKDLIPPPSPRAVYAIIVNGGVEITWEEVFDFDMEGYNIYRCDIPTGIYSKINSQIIKDLRYLDREGRDFNFYIVKAVDSSGNESTQGDYASPQK